MTVPDRFCYAQSVTAYNNLWAIGLATEYNIEGAGKAYYCSPEIGKPHHRSNTLQIPLTKKPSQNQFVHFHFIPFFG